MTAKRLLIVAHAPSPNTAIQSVIALFIFPQGSRNAFNNLRQEAKFAKHYRHFT